MRAAFFPLLKLLSFPLILVGLLLSACSAPQAPAPSQTSPVQAPTEVITEAPAESATATQSAATGLDISTAAPRGETIASADFEYTVLDVLRGEEAVTKLKDASYVYRSPDDNDLEYVIVFIRVRYTGNSTEALRVDPNCLDYTWSGGTQYDKPSIVDVTNPQPYLQAELLPGEQVEGWVTMLARKDDPAPVLVVQPRINGMSTGMADQRYLSLAE